MRSWSMARCVALASLLPAMLAAQSGPNMTVAVEPSHVAAIASRVPAGTVALALGNVGIASTDADVLFYNPGMLTSGRGMSLSAQRYNGNGTAASMAATQLVGSVGFGIGVRFADWRGPLGFGYAEAVRDGLGVLGLPGAARASSTALTAAAARALGPVRLGVSATYARETYAARHDETTHFDVGVVWPTGPGNLALTVQHEGAPLEIADGFQEFEGAAEWRATLGYGAWGFPLATFWDFGGTAQLSVDEAGKVRSAGGVELTYVPVEGVSIAARVGSRSTIGNELPITGGLGLSLDRYSLDYALESFRGGVRAHRVGLRVR